MPNQSFEIAGTEPGLASAWTLAINITSFLFASYARADGGESRFEGFEYLWGADPFVGALVVPTNAETGLFGPTGFLTPFDGFEHFWSNDGFLFDLDTGVLAAFGALPSSNSFEGFESEWANDGFLFELGSVATDLWNGGADPADGFETSWVTGYLSSFSPGDLSAAIFHEGGATGPAETFESSVFDQAFGVTLPSTINCPGHGFSNGANVVFFPSLFGSSVLPSGLSTQLTYQVTAATTNTFEVQESGTTVNLGTTGAGQVFVRADPTITWGGINGDMQGQDP